MLSIIDIIEDTTVDGPGFRTAIYAAGCPNKCPGCHNPESWDIHKGKKVRTEEIVEKVLADEFANVTFSGGDPMFQPEGFTELAEKATAEELTKAVALSAALAQVNAAVDMYELTAKQLKLAATTSITIKTEVTDHE